MPNAKKHTIVQAGLCSKSSLMFVANWFMYASFSRLVYTPLCHVRSCNKDDKRGWFEPNLAFVRDTSYMQDNKWLLC